jgi:valyl-tRNA synthetase
MTALSQARPASPDPAQTCVPAVRKQLWADMEAQGLVIKSEPYQTRVPRSQRGGEIVEPLVREQWFVRMEPLAKPALEVGTCKGSVGRGSRGRHAHRLMAPCGMSRCSSLPSQRRRPRGSLGAPSAFPPGAGGGAGRHPHPARAL